MYNHLYNIVHIPFSSIPRAMEYNALRHVIMLNPPLALLFPTEFL